MSVFTTVAQVLAAGGVGGFCTEVVRGLSTRRKLRAEAAKTGVDANVALSNAAMALLEPAREQIAFLHSELTAARAEGKALRLEVNQLREQVASLDCELQTAHRDLNALQQGLKEEAT
jgi:septal ring factor EnvC (AmiA/AmiB activator)